MFKARYDKLWSGSHIPDDTEYSEYSQDAIKLETGLYPSDINGEKFKFLKNEYGGWTPNQIESSDKLRKLLSLKQALFLLCLKILRSK